MRAICVFDFLIKEIPGFQGKSIDEITINDLANVQATHIEMFLSYLPIISLTAKGLPITKGLSPVN